MTTYQCPACGTAADLGTGCPRCGRPSDLDDARLAAMDGEIAALVTRIEAARAEYGDATQAWQARQLERGALVGAIRTRVAYEVRAAQAAGAQPPPVAPPSLATPPVTMPTAPPVTVPRPAGPDMVSPPGPGVATPTVSRLGAPDAQPRTVQNLLFILGAVLVVIGAVAFKVFAWSTIGVAGRATILGVATVAALAVPLIAARRHLTATAETFAVIGLAFLFIDGFGVWSLNLFGVADSIRATNYTGIVFAVVSMVAVGYALLTKLVGPRFVALLALQPVPLLVASTDHGSAPGLTTVLAVTSILDLIVIARLRRPTRTDPTSTDPTRSDPTRRGSVVALLVVAWTAVVVTLGAATIASLAALIPDSRRAAALAALVILLVAAVTLAAGRIGSAAALRGVAGAIAVIEVVIAVARLITIQIPGYGLFIVAIVAAGFAAGVAYLPETLWPRIGPRIGMYVVIGFLDLATLIQVLGGTGRYLEAIAPIWRAPIAALAHRDLGYGWQTPAAIVSLTIAIVALIPRGRIAATLPGAVLVAFAIPVCFRLPWWGSSIVDFLILVPLAILATRSAGRVAAVGAAIATPIVALHAFGFALVRPATTAAVLFGIAIIGVVMAALGRGMEPVRRAVAGLGLAAALIVLPGAVASAFAIRAAHGVLPERATMATVVVVACGLFALRRLWTDLRWYALGAVTLTAVVAGLLPVAVRDGEPLPLYAVLGLLIVAAAPALSGVHGRRSFRTVGAGIVLVPAIAWRVLPIVATVAFLPYAWLTSIWSGVPDGVGLAPHHVWHLDVVDVATMVLLTLTMAVLGAMAARGEIGAIGGKVRGALAAGLPPAVATVPVILTAAGLAWPTVPATSIVLGAAGVLFAVLAPGGRGPRLSAGITGLVALGAGVAGSLPTKTSTIAALGVVFVVAVVTGVASRSVGVRVVGWLGAVAGGAALVFASMRALDIEVGLIAFGILAVAALAVFTGARIGGERESSHRGEGVALAAAGHATAFVALLLTGGLVRAALASAIWGLVVGLRALWPGLGATYRRTLASIAAGLELLGWWFLLGANDVRIVDAYTVPLAVVALVAGWLALRSRPELRSWVAYGPALAAGFLPSLAPLLTGDASVTRRLVLGGLALATVLVGAWAHLQAPVIIGTIALLVVAIHELVLLWQLLPTWIPLSAAGLLVLLLAVTYERRRRDVVRLRGAVARMT